MTALAPTLSLRLFPRTASWLRDLFLILAGSWLVAFFAQLEIPMQPVPITGQTFAVLLVGALLGSKRGVAAMIAYIAQGGLGLPFFAGGASGFGILTGATAGYLLGFIGAAYVVGWLAEKGLERSVRTSILPFFVGTVIIYIFGVAWLSIVLGSLSKAIQFGLLPFLVGDVIKLMAAAIVLPSAWKFVK
ncbi:MAG: biotin transporter BioY [Anaerolineales bacterium]|nr:biotin transporter BioY [Anaerolineales bacterium]